MTSKLALPAFDQNTPENKVPVNFFASRERLKLKVSVYIYTFAR